MKLLFEEEEFVIDEFHFSSTSESGYFSCHRISAETKQVIKFEFYSRISAHPLTLAKQQQQERYFKTGWTHDLEKALNKKIQGSAYVYIYINNKRYLSFTSALKYVMDEIESWRLKYGH